MRRTPEMLSIATAVTLAVVAGAATVAAAGVPRAPQVTAIQIRPISPTSPVSGADGQQHLVYELEISNRSDKAVTFQSVEALDPFNGNAVLTKMDGTALARTLRVDGGDIGTVLAPGAGGILFMDVTLPARTEAPRSLKHRVAYDLTDSAGTQSEAFVGVSQRVTRTRAVVVAPPLTGEHWVVGNGCCGDITAHRGATLPIDGTIHVPERFAIDFVQLDDELKLFSGPVDDPESYPGFGAEVHSVAAGRVVQVEDGHPEQVPGSRDPNATVQTAGGNSIVVDIGRGRFAYYAHLQPGSVQVAKGDRVKAGQVLGLLGNTGNTDGPHLHFHVMDGPSPFRADGLPYEFGAFVGEGLVTNPIEDVQQGAAAQLDETYVGAHRSELPLNLQVIAFPRAAAGGGDARV